MTNPATASDFCFSLRRGQERNLRCDGHADVAIAREEIHLGFSVSALLCFDCYLTTDFSFTPPVFIFLPSPDLVPRLAAKSMDLGVNL